MNIIDRIFGKKEKSMSENPGRTFTRIMTGDYFGLRNEHASAEDSFKAKEEKIAQIKELGLVPKYVRYQYNEGLVTHNEEDIHAAHVTFQKEEFDPKQNKVHVTEISFIVPKEEFAEFEQMAGVSLKEDFRNLYESEKVYDGEDRRKAPRPSPFEKL